MLLTDLNCGILEAGEHNAPQLEDVFDKLCDQHKLESSLSDLSKMGAIELLGDLVVPGLNLEVDNNP